MRSFKKIFSGILVLCLMVVTLFTGCGSNNAASNSSTDSNSNTQKAEQSAPAKTEKVTLKFLHRFPEEPYSGFIKSVVADFEKAHDNIKIDIQTADNNSYNQKLKTMIGGNGAPDLFYTYSGEYLNQFVREERVYDLTGELNSDSNWKNNYMPSQLSPFAYKDKTYATPFRTDVKVFFYNTKIFDQYNLQIPKTWDEFIKVCDTLKKNGVTPISFGNSEKWPACHYLTTLNQKIISDDVRAHDYNPANGGFTDPLYVKSLNMFQQLIPYFNASPDAVSHEVERTNFANGKAAMDYLESVELPYLAKGAPKDFSYGMFPFPAIADGKGNQDYVTGAPEGFAVSSSTKNPKEAVEFLKYLTGQEVGKKEVQAIQWFNGNKDIVDQNSSNKALTYCYNTMVNAKGLANWLDTDVNSQIVDVYLSGIQQVIDGQSTPEKVMKSVSDTSKTVSQTVSK